MGDSHAHARTRWRGSRTSRCATSAATAREIHWDFIRAALASVADTAIVPLQDVLGLGSEARMNLPGRARGNWRFRLSWEQLTPGRRAAAARARGHATTA